MGSESHLWKMMEWWGWTRRANKIESSLNLLKYSKQRYPWEMISEYIISLGLYAEHYNKHYIFCVWAYLYICYTCKTMTIVDNTHRLLKIFIFSLWLLYNIGLISVIHQCELSIGIHMSPPFWISLPHPAHSHPSQLLQSPSLSSLNHTENSHWLSIHIC